jgi:hypothetical protein
MVRRQGWASTNGTHTLCMGSGDHFWLTRRGQQRRKAGAATVPWFAPGARSAGALLVIRNGRAGANGCIILRKPRAVEASIVRGRGGVSPVETCLTVGTVRPLASRVWIRRVGERRAPDNGRPAPACVGRQKTAGAPSGHPPHHRAITEHRAGSRGRCITRASERGLRARIPPPRIGGPRLPTPTVAPLRGSRVKATAVRAVRWFRTAVVQRPPETTPSTVTYRPVFGGEGAAGACEVAWQELRVRVTCSSGRASRARGRGSREIGSRVGALVPSPPRAYPTVVFRAREPAR